MKNVGIDISSYQYLLDTKFLELVFAARVYAPKIFRDISVSLQLNSKVQKYTKSSWGNFFVCVISDSMVKQSSMQLYKIYVYEKYKKNNIIVNDD